MIWYATSNLRELVQNSKVTWPKDIKRIKTSQNHSITKSYKKTNTTAINNINKEAKFIAERLHLDDRVEQFNQREAFVTLKDHKENFQNNPKCRLLNSAKSEIGISSKHYIEKKR